MRLKQCGLLILGLGLSACGGSSKPAEEPAAEPKTEATAKPETKEPAEKPPVAENNEKPAKADESSEGPKVTRTPKDILTAPDVVFMFSFNQSDMGERAEKQCDEQAKDNPKKRADCMTRAKQKIEIDGMRFKQEHGRWYWSTIRRKGKILINVNKVPVEFGKEDEHSIVLKPSGKDEGTKPGKLSDTTVEVPNEYQIVINDPKQGKMVFEAKIGLVEN